MNRPPQTKQARRQTQREERRRQEELRKHQEQRRRTMLIVSAVVVVVLIAAATTYFLTLPKQTPTEAAHAAATTTSATVTAAAVANPTYPPVDNITCDSSEQLAYHIHAHLSMYVNGQPVALPQNVGIASNQSCIYWLHTHDTSGVIHIESPTQKIYTLGNFLNVWQQRFSSLGYPSQLSQSAGWKIYVNGKAYNGSIPSIPLNAHTLITLAYNSPNAQPDTTYNWNGL